MYQLRRPLSIPPTATRFLTSISSGPRLEGLLSLFDQSVVSGVAFLTTVLIGRWCGTEELGVYSLGFTAVVVMTNAQAALVTAPYTNQWRARARADQTAFAGGALIQQVVLSLGMSAALGLTGILLWLLGFHGRINAILLVVAAVAPMLLLREFSRRFAFSHLRMGTACLIDCVVSVAQVSGLFLIFLGGQLSANSAYVALGLSALIGGGLGQILLRRLFTIRFDLLIPSFREHWSFGRWVLASSMLATLQAYVVHWLLAFMMGTAQTGVYSACLTSVLVLNPLLLGVGNVLGPMAARAFASGGLSRLRALVWKVSSSLIPVLGIYAAMVCLFGDRVIAFLYASSEYYGQGHLLTVFALTIFSVALDLPVDSGLRAMNRPDIGFRASLISTLLVVIASSLLIPKYGMLGGAYAGLIGQSLGVVVRILAFTQLCRSELLKCQTEQTDWKS
jgi:O-antigen/teichoic acid export membrane protein